MSTTIRNSWAAYKEAVGLLQASANESSLLLGYHNRALLTEICKLQSSIPVIWPGRGEVQKEMERQEGIGGGMHEK